MKHFRIMIYMTRKKTHEEFLKEVKGKTKQFEILSKYEGATKTMKFRCKKCGTVFEIRPNSFKKTNCRICSFLIRAEQKKKGFNEWYKNLPKKYKDYEFSDYTSARGPITAKHLICGRVHRYADAGVFTQGEAGCRSCNCALKKEDAFYSGLCDEKGFYFIKRDKKNITVKCKKCGKQSIKNSSNLYKSGCKFCSSAGISEAERSIFNWVKTIVPDAVQSDRTVLKNISKHNRSLELDIYVPSKKIAIEYNGSYWHSVSSLMENKKLSYAEAKKYHQEKSIECEKKGIRLIYIWDYEWQDPVKQKVLKNIILGALKALPERFYARECKVKYYDNNSKKWNELNKFFEENNIQGNRGGNFVYTLEKNERILMAYKFGEPFGGRAKQKYQYEMVRGASAYGVQVVGGATKLWKHFIKDKAPESVVYYIDYNYFNGSSVEKIGLNCIGMTPGVKNYFTSTKEVKNRQPAKHHEIMEKIKSGEVLELWNAGTKTYIYEKK